MSIKQIQKVFTDTKLKGNEKLLMLAIADNCNDSGVAFPSWNSLITKTSMSKGSVSKWLKELEKKGLLFRVSRNRKNGSRTSNKYLIYPYENKMFLDEEELDIFSDNFNQSSEVELVRELNIPSSKVELENGGQSSEVEHLEPSLSSNRKIKPSDNIDYSFFSSMWNEYAKKTNKSVILKVTSDRRSKIKTRYKEVKDFKEVFKVAIDKASKSSFLSKSEWFNFDWLVKNDTNIIKVIEDTYKDKEYQF